MYLLIRPKRQETMPKTLVEYAQQLKDVGDVPNLLAELDRELSGNLVYLYEKKIKPNSIEKAKFWEKKYKDDDGNEREKALSDTALDAMWRLTEGGQDEIKLDITIKGYEVLLRSIKNSLIAKSVELKHLD